MGLVIGSSYSTSANWQGWREPITWEDNDSFRSDQLSEIDATINLARFHSDRGEFAKTVPLIEEAVQLLTQIRRASGQRMVSALLIKAEALSKVGMKNKAQSCFLSALKLMRSKNPKQDAIKAAYDDALAACLNQHLASSKRISDLMMELSKLPDPATSDWKARFLLIGALCEARMGNLEKASLLLSKANATIKLLKPPKPIAQVAAQAAAQAEPKPNAKPLSDTVLFALAEKKRWKLPKVESFLLYVEGVLLVERGRHEDASQKLGEAISKMQVAGGSDFYILLAYLEQTHNHLSESKLKDAMHAMRSASYNFGKSELERQLVKKISLQLQTALEAKAIGLLQSNEFEVPTSLPDLSSLSVPRNRAGLAFRNRPELAFRNRAALIETGEELAQLAKFSRQQDEFDNAIGLDLSAIAVLWACGSQTERLAECWYNIGDSYIESKRFQLAIEPLQRALALRLAINPISDSSFSAAQMLARAYRQSKQYADAELVTKFSIARACASARASASSSASGTSKRSVPNVPNDLVDKSIEEFLKETVDTLRPGEMSRQKRLADLLQQWADVLGEQKRPDDAIKVIHRLIAVKKSDPTQYKLLWNDIWSLAWQLQASRNFDGARDQYSLMIDKYPDVIPKIKGDWYYYRGLNQDLNNRSEAAKQDFKTAAKFYRKAINDGSDDQGWLDWIAFMEYDMKEQVQMKRDCPPTRRDYVDALPASHWEKSRMPIKIFIDSSKESGFGPRFVSCFRRGFEVWANIPESYLRCKFIDNPEDADVVVKRVEEYREIPPGSGGRTISFYKFRGNHRTKLLDQVRIIMFCTSYNGEGMAPFDQKDLCGLNMHEAGHAFGLQHSPHGPDVMYWKSMAPELTEKDKESIRILYPLNAKTARKD